MGNYDKIILDFCGGTGEWSREYRLHAYQVIIVTLPYYDILTYKLPTRHIYGILAAPPCDDFAGSGARWWPEKDASGRTAHSLEIVSACLSLMAQCDDDLVFYSLENPVGRLRRLMPELGAPTLIFNPCDYGDPWTKKTCLWGKFNLPKVAPVEPVFYYTSTGARSNENWRKFWGANPETKIIRSITAPHFAKAFYEANK